MNKNKSLVVIKYSLLFADLNQSRQPKHRLGLFRRPEPSRAFAWGQSEGDDIDLSGAQYMRSGPDLGLVRLVGGVPALERAEDPGSTRPVRSNGKLRGHSR